MSIKIKKEECFVSDEDVDVPRKTVAHSRHRAHNSPDDRRRSEDKRHRGRDRDRSSHRSEDPRRERVVGGYNRRREEEHSREERGGRIRDYGGERNRDGGRNRRGRGRGGGAGEGDGRQKEVWGKPEDQEPEDKPPVKKEEPSLALTGKLTEETNTFRGVVIKYNEPEDARKPSIRWRLYPFKGDQPLPVLYIHRQSGYLVGRDHKICDIPMDHPSISKQHAVIQFRQIEYDRPNNKKGVMITPYLIDLESANGTYLNNQRIDATRYVELREKDMIKFGFSTREYVLLTEATAGGEQSPDD